MSLLSTSLKTQKRPGYFFLAFSNIYLMFPTARSALGLYAGSDPKIRGGIPQNTSRRDGPFFAFST